MKVHVRNVPKSQEVKHKLFPWGMTAIGAEKTLKDVEVFLNEVGAENVISVMSILFGVIVWYKVGKSPLTFK